MVGNEAGNSGQHDPSAGLRKKATQGGIYTAIAVSVGFTLALVQLAIIARLLEPVDFGVFALGTVFLTAANTFSSLGTEKILIQRPTITTSFIQSAWLVMLIRGAVLSAICLLAAPLYSALVDEPLVSKVLGVIALVPLLSSMASPHMILANRQLEFGRLAAFQITANILQFAIIVWLAWSLRNVYALAWGQVAGAAIQTILSWLWFGVPRRPRFIRDSFLELISTGRHYLVIAAGTFIMTQGDHLIVGTVLGAATLGIYVLAYKASQFALDIVRTTLGRVAFPVFSRLQTQPERLLSAFQEIWRFQVALLLPLVAAMVLFADDVVLVLYGSRYEGVADILRILAVLTVGRGVSHLLAPFIIGTGGVGYASGIKVFETALFLIAVWVGVTHYGLPGVAWGAGATYLVSAIARLVYAMRYLKLGIYWFVRSVAGTIGAVLIGIMSVRILHPQWTAFVNLMVLGAIFLVAYIAASLILQRDLLPSIRKNLKSLWSV